MGTWATEVTTVSTAGTPLTLAQLKALSGTGGHVAFANLGSNPWTNKWLANPSNNSNLTLSKVQLYTITNGSVTDKYYLQCVNDNKYRTNSGWGDLASAENIEFRAYTASTPTVKCNNPISIHNSSGTNWNINYGSFGGNNGAWAAYAAYGPFYLLTVNLIDDDTSETFLSFTKIVTNGHTYEIPSYVGRKLKDGEPTSVTISGADAEYTIHYESSTFDYSVVITGDDTPAGTEITIKGDDVTNGDAVSYETAVEASDIVVTYPDEYDYMDYSVTISGPTITITCIDTRWPLNFDKFTLRSTHDSRYTDKVGLNNQSITFAGAKGDLIYRDITNQKIFVLPAGATVTPVIGYRGWAMYGYLYIDYNNDCDFSDSGELVSQLAGNTWAGNKSDKTIPDFTLTSTPGDYRIRFKVEWDNTDPGGGSQISEHGGCIIDATLKVIANPFFRLYAEEDSKYLQGDGSLTYNSDTGKASIWYYDGTKICNFSGNFNSSAQFFNTTSADTYNITAGEELGKSFNFVEDVDELPVSISSVGYATLYAPVALTIPSGVDVYTATDEGEYLHLEEIEGQTIPANTGVILAGSAGTYDFSITDDVSPISSALTGSVAAIDRPEGSYILSTSGGANVGFYKDGASTIPGFKAYLAAGSGEVRVKTFYFGDLTGVKAIEKALLSGKTVYDLSGRRVEQPVKGVYIVNGKKVVIK